MSPRAMRIARKVLAMTPAFVPCRRVLGGDIDLHCMVSEFEWRDIRALAASCLAEQPIPFKVTTHKVSLKPALGRAKKWLGYPDKPKRKRKKT